MGRYIDTKSSKYNDRYNSMLLKFAEWEPLFQKVDNDDLSRNREVLFGCFVGSRNEAIVEALRLVYTEYTVLRMAGDLIFTLVTKVVERQKIHLSEVGRM